MTNPFADLERMRDSFKPNIHVTREALEALLDELKRMQAERDALAAHVERLHMAWVDAKRCVSVVAFPALYRVEQYQHLAKRSIEKLESVVSDTPNTSLARQKLLWQAEAISRYAAERLGGTDQELAEIYASKLRRQAEETTQ